MTEFLIFKILMTENRDVQYCDSEMLKTDFMTGFDKLCLVNYSTY